MGRNLGPLNIKDSYEGLVQISGSQLTDGSGSLISNLEVTASYATTADTSISASYAQTSTSASHALVADTSTQSKAFRNDVNLLTYKPIFVEDGADGNRTLYFNQTSNILINPGAGKIQATSITSSFTGSLQGNATTATTASYALTSSFAENGFPYTGSAQISGSLRVIDEIIVGASNNSITRQAGDDNFAIVGGGSNTINHTFVNGFGDNLTIVGGISNTISGQYLNESSIFGGQLNNINAQYSNIFGGRGNSISNEYLQTMLGGNNNIISGGGAGKVIVGGDGNGINGGSYNVAIGGTNNVVSHNYSAVIGGNGLSSSKASEVVVPSLVATELTASGLAYPSTDGTAGEFITTDGSGTLSWATGSGGGSTFPYTGSAGITGSLNVVGPIITGDGTNVVGTNGNEAAIGGRNNSVTGNIAVAVGGEYHNVTGFRGGAFGGEQSTVAGTNSTVVGGYNNQAGSSYDAVIGGTANISSNTSAVVVGGTNNAASHARSIVLGGNGLATTKADEVIVPNLNISGSLTDSTGSIGTAGQVLLSDGVSKVLWTTSAGGAAFPYTGSATISGSLSIEGTLAISGSTFISSSVLGTGSLIDNLGQEGVGTTDSINHIVYCTQAEYSGLTPDTNTMYVISGSGDVVGDLVVSGSLIGEVRTLTDAAGTTTMDCSLGNFFTLAMPAGGSTTLTPSNIQAGQTINVKITQNATPSTIAFAASVDFEGGTAFAVSTGAGQVDVMTFISFDGTTLQATGLKNFS